MPTPGRCSEQACAVPSGASVATATSGSTYVSGMANFVVREWTRDPYPREQARLHIHHRGHEAFYVLGGRLDGQDGDQRHRVETGGLHVVSAGSAHTFATVDDRPVQLLAVVTPEIEQLIQRIHSGDVHDMAAYGPNTTRPWSTDVRMSAASRPKGAGVGHTSSGSFDVRCSSRLRRRCWA